jgi:hypothetical protein
VFRFGIPTVTAFGGYDASGYLGLVLTSSYSIATPQVGDRLYIYSGAYSGFHTITEVISGIQFVTSTEYTTAYVWNSNLVGFVYLPTVKVYRGYSVGEIVLTLYPTGTIDLSTIQPRELVAEFSPEVGSDGFIEFDLHGYLKTCLYTPYKVGYNQNETDLIYDRSATIQYVPMNYSKVDLVIENGLECSLYLANAGIETNDLNRYYVDTNQPMQPLQSVAEFTGKQINDTYFIQSTQIVKHGN